MFGFQWGLISFLWYSYVSLAHPDYKLFAARGPMQFDVIHIMSQKSALQSVTWNEVLWALLAEEWEGSQGMCVCPLWKEATCHFLKRLRLESKCAPCQQVHPCCSWMGPTVEVLLSLELPSNWFSESLSTSSHHTPLVWQVGLHTEIPRKITPPTHTHSTESLDSGAALCSTVRLPMTPWALSPNGPSWAQYPNLYRWSRK